MASYLPDSHFLLSHLYDQEVQPKMTIHSETVHEVLINNLEAYNFYGTLAKFECTGTPLFKFIV